MERLYSQPDVIKKILSEISPKDVLSMKQTEKKLEKMIQASPNDIALVQAFRSLGVLIYYHQLFQELYSGNQEINVEIYSSDPNLVRMGRRKYKPFQILIHRSQDGDWKTFEVQDRNISGRNITLINPSPFTLASVISQYLFDPLYSNYRWVEDLDEIELDYTSTVITTVYGKRNHIAQIVNEIVDHGDELEKIMRKNGILPTNPLFDVIQDEMLKILKSMV
jgi:hypothetical protein